MVLHTVACHQLCKRLWQMGHISESELIVDGVLNDLAVINMRN